MQIAIVQEGKTHYLRVNNKSQGFFLSSPDTETQGKLLFMWLSLSVQSLSITQPAAEVLCLGTEFKFDLPNGN